jgi:hypothetical protein
MHGGRDDPAAARQHRRHRPIAAAVKSQSGAGRRPRSSDDRIAFFTFQPFNTSA